MPRQDWWLLSFEKGPKVWSAVVGLVILQGPIWLFLWHKNTKIRRVKFNPERILIVGASSGVGEAIALHYARSRGKEVSLCLVARRQPQEVCRKVLGFGASGSYAACADVTEASDVLRLHADICRQWNRLDTLIIWYVTPSK